MNIKTDFLLPALLLFTCNSYALDWFMAPGFNFSERYNDNLFLQRKESNPNPPGNRITSISPNLRLGYIDDDNELTGTLGWNQLIYHDQTNADFSEKTANLNYLYSWELWKAKLRANYAELSSLGTQLNVNGSGYAGVQVPAFNESVSPSITYQLSEKNSLALDYSHINVRFGSHPVNQVFSNYISQSYNVTATHAYTEKLTFNLTGGYSLFDSGNTSNLGNFLRLPQFPYTLRYSQKSTTLTYQLGMQYAFDERTTFSGSAGIRDTTSNYVDTYNAAGYPFPCFGNPGSPTCPNFTSAFTTTSSGKIYSASLSRSFEQGSINLSYNQQLTPASTGTQQTTTSFSAAGNYNLSEHWKAGLTGTYLKSVALTSGSASNANYTNLNRNLTSFSPNVQWQWTQDISLQFSYTYQNQDYYLAKETAMQNVVQLQFFYQPSINRQVK